MLNNPDFYPTPSNIIHKMLSKIDFKYINSVLEPSAGKGDLVEAINKQFEYSQGRYSNKKKHDIDTIEIDENLQHILKGKNMRVVHDDFLTFSTYKKYDTIIANFPFSSGEKHLIKAIEMQEVTGGQIVCLVNSETLKNPYTNIRKDIIRKLDEYNAEVEFIENGFINAERKTNVEIALISIKFPKKENSSIILNELKQEEVHNTNTIHDNNYLIESDFIKGIVQQYNFEVKAGLKLIEEYNNLKPFMLGGFNENSAPVLQLGIGSGNNQSTSLENDYIKQIRLKYWRALFNNDKFMGLFTSNLKRKYMEQVEELENYDFSFFNIYSIRIQLNKDMTQGVEETILNLFEEFSHKHHYDESSKNTHLYNGWKTNKSYKINKKVIIPLNSYTWFDNSYRPTDYQVLDKLKDIEKVFNYLDGGITDDIDIDQTLKMAEHYQETKKIELKYFLITFYKKGTCHIEFKNMELLHKFNFFAAKSKMWIPNSFGKTAYGDMSKEEKDVVDSFCGKEQYKKYVDNIDYYLYEPSKSLLLIEGTA